MFDINSSDAFFRTIRRNVEKLHSQTAKETDRLLFVIFSLNHLREWTAPNYKRSDSPTNDAQRFFQSIYSSCPSFQLLNKICNHTKHLTPIGIQDTGYGSLVDDWPDWDAVESVDAGPPTSYAVDGKDVLEAIDEVVDFYQSHWFDRP